MVERISIGLDLSTTTLSGDSTSNLLAPKERKETFKQIPMKFFSLLNSKIIVFGLIGSLFISLSISYLAGAFNYHTPSNLAQYTTKFPFTNEVHIGYDGSIVLLGDSLIAYSCQDNDLPDKIDKYIDYSVQYSNCGKPSHTIQNIRDRLGPLLSNIWSKTSGQKQNNNKKSFIMVILFWDSDVSDIDESGLTESEVYALRSTYETNVRYVVENLLDAGAYVALAGPGVLKRNLGFEHKSQMLNAYRDINIAVCLSYGIEYIDVRSALWKSIDRGVDPTRDGEHLNDLGVTIVAKLFAEAIHQWKE